MRAPSSLISHRVEHVASTACCAYCQGDGVARVAGVTVVCACRPFDLDARADGASGDHRPALVRRPLLSTPFRSHPSTPTRTHR